MDDIDIIVARVHANRKASTNHHKRRSTHSRTIYGTWSQLLLFILFDKMNRVSSSKRPGA